MCVRPRHLPQCILSVSVAYILAPNPGRVATAAGSALTLQQPRLQPQPRPEARASPAWSRAAIRR